MQLFNVDHENWEEVGVANLAPPNDALAYELESASWITTEEELNEISHHRAGSLRYTHRGIGVLRQQGYEG